MGDPIEDISLDREEDSKDQQEDGELYTEYRNTIEHISNV